jgi:hypothetical protein
MSLRNPPKIRLVSPETPIGVKRETKRNETRNETVSCLLTRQFEREGTRKSETGFFGYRETKHPKNSLFRFISFHPGQEAVP